MCVCVLLTFVLFLVTAEAAEILLQNRRLFEQNVARAMRGGYVGTVHFDRCINH